MGRKGNLVTLFSAIPHAPWASLWVNIGDKRDDGELLRIPHRFCNAMADAGFRLIDEVIWAKESVQISGASIGHSMIEPATRRLNGNGFEPFFHFVLDKKKAWSDTTAVRIPRRNVASRPYLPKALMHCDTSLEGRNLSNVWNIPMAQTTKSHFAVFHPALIERPVAMTCPFEITELGPRERIVEFVEYDEGLKKNRRIGKYKQAKHGEDVAAELEERSGRHDTARIYTPRKPVTIGWTFPDLAVMRRGIVFDPFTGSGTSGEVAIKLGRNFIGVELYPQYAQMSEERCRQAEILRRTYEAANISASSADTSALPLDNTMPHHASHDLDCGDAGAW